MTLCDEVEWKIEKFEEERDSEAVLRITQECYQQHSPATFPNAHAACSLTSSLGDISNRINIGTAPASL